MGKTSIAEFITEEVKEVEVLSVYVSNKNNNSVDTLVSMIMKALLNKLPPKIRTDKIKSWFGDHVSEITTYGTKINFNIDKSKEENIKNNFLDYLLMAFEDLKEYYKAIFIIIDDINGLSESREFVDWYKQFADTVCVDEYYELPIYFLLEGYSEKYDNLVELEQSFGRIFHYADVKSLANDEVKKFFTDMFKSIDVSIDEDALEFMVEYSCGIPLIMQCIGDSVFWNLDKNNISIVDAKEGIIQASKNLENNKIRRTLKRMDNLLFDDILVKIASNNLNSFTFNDLKNVLTEKEMDYLPDFIDVITSLEILEKEEFKSESYTFKDKTFYAYYRMKAFEKEYNQ